MNITKSKEAGFLRDTSRLREFKCITHFCPFFFYYVGQLIAQSVFSLSLYSNSYPNPLCRPTVHIVFGHTLRPDFFIIDNWVTTGIWLLLHMERDTFADQYYIAIFSWLEHDYEALCTLAYLKSRHNDWFIYTVNSIQLIFTLLSLLFCHSIYLSFIMFIFLLGRLARGLHLELEIVSGVL